jgi:hypothetical protein
LEVVRDDERAAVETALDNPAIAVLWAERDVIDVSRVILANRVNLLLALKFGYGYLRN